MLSPLPQPLFARLCVPVWCVCVGGGFSIATLTVAVVLHPLSLVLCIEQLCIKYVTMDGLMDFIAQAGDYFC